MTWSERKNAVRGESSDSRVMNAVSKAVKIAIVGGENAADFSLNQAAKVAVAFEPLTNKVGEKTGAFSKWLDNKANQYDERHPSKKA